MRNVHLSREAKRLALFFSYATISYLGLAQLSRYFFLKSAIAVAVATPMWAMYCQSYYFFRSGIAARASWSAVVMK